MSNNQNATVNAQIHAGVDGIEQIEKYTQAVKEAIAATEKLVSLQGNGISGSGHAYVGDKDRVTFADGTTQKQTARNKAAITRQHTLDDMAARIDLRAGRMTAQQFFDYAMSRTDPKNAKRSERDMAMTARLQSEAETKLMGEQRSRRASLMVAQDRAIRAQFIESGKTDIDRIVNHLEGRVKDESLPIDKRMGYAEEAAKTMSSWMQRLARDSKQGRSATFSELEAKVTSSTSSRQMAGISRQMQDIIAKADPNEAKRLQIRMDKIVQGNRSRIESEQVISAKANYESRIGAEEATYVAGGRKDPTALAQALRDAANSDEYGPREKVRLANRAARLEAQANAQANQKSAAEAIADQRALRNDRLNQLRALTSHADGTVAEQGRLDLIRELRQHSLNPLSEHLNISERTALRKELSNLVTGQDSESILKMARKNQVAFNTGQMGHDEYRKFLLGQLTATEEYSTRWKRVWDEIIRVDRLIEQHRKATENPTGGKGSSEKKPGVSTPFAEQDPHFKSAQWEEAMKKGANPAMLMANTFLPRNTKGRVIANVANALDKVGLKWDQLGIGYSPFDMAQMGLQAFQEREEAQMLGDLELRSNAAQQKANKKPFDSEADIQALNKRIRKAAMETLPIKGGVVSLMKIKEAIASEGISAKDLDMPLDAIARFQKFNQGMGPEDIAHNAAQTIESMEHTILKDAIKRGVVPQGTTNVYDKRIDAVGNLLGGIEYGKFNTRATAPQIMVLVSKMAGVSNSVGLSLQDNISLSSAMADMKITPGQGTTAVSKTIRALFTAADSYQGNGKYDKNLGLLSQVLYGAKGQEAIDEGAKQFAQTFRSSPIKAIGEFIDKLQIMQKQGQNIPTLFKAMGLGGDRMAQTMTQLAGAEKPFSEFAKGMEDIGNKSAWLKKTSEPLLNDVNSKIEKFTAHIREFAAMFIEAFSGKIEIVLNIFKQFMDVVGHVVEGFAAMPDGLKNVIISTVAVVMAMRGLAGVLAPVVQGFSSLYQLWTSYTELGFIKGVLIPAKEAMLGEAAATTEDTLAKEANTVALEQNTAAAIENKEAHSGFTGILDGFIGKWGELSLVLAGIALAYDGITKAQKAYQASAKNDAPLPKVHNWLPGDPNKPDSNAHDATVKKFKDVNTGPADPAQKDFFNLWGNIGESFDKLDNADARFRAIKSDPVAITLFKKQQALSDKKLIQLWAKNNPNYADMNRGQLPDDLKRALGRHGVGADWSVKDSIETGISRADADYVDARKWGAKYLKSAKQEDSLVGTPAMNALTGGTPSLSESYSKPVVDTLTGKNLSIDGKTDLKSILGQTQYQLTPAQQAKLAADKYGEQKNRAENDMADVKQKIKDSLDAMKEGKTTLEGKVLTKSILYGYAEQLRGATKQRDDAVLAAEKLEKQAKGFALDAKTIQGERAKLAGARDREYDSETAQIDEALKAVRKKRLDNEIQALEASKKNLESQKEELDAQLSMALGVQEKHQIRTQILAKEREIMDKEFQVQLKRIEKMDKGAEKDKAKDEYVQGRTTRERVYNINKSKEGRDTILELLDERAGLSSADSWMDRTEADRMKRENFADKSKLGMNSLMQWFGGEPIMSPAEKRMAWARIQGRTDKLDEFNQSRQLALDEVGISDGENATDNYQRLLSYNKKKRAYLQFFKPDELDQFNAQSKIAERKAGRESSLDQMEEALSGFGLGKVGAGASVQSARGFFEMAMGRSVSDAEKSATAGSYLQNLERAYNGSFSTTGKLDQDSISKVLREMGLVRQDAKSRGDLGTYLQSGEQMGSLIQSIMSMQYERIDKSGLQEADRYKAIRATNELLKMIPEWQSLPPDIIKSLSEGMDERERKFRDNQPFRKAGLEARRSFEGSIDGDVEGLGSKLIEGAFKGHKVNKKEAYKQFWDEILGTGTQSLAHVAWSGVIKPEMTKVFDGLKEGLLEIWHGGEASWGQMINASLTALNAIMLAGAGGKKAQKGGLLGGLLGGVLGFAIGGPAGALEGFNIGAAAGAAYSTGGLGAGLLAGGGSYVAYRGPGMFGVGSQAASATGGSTGYRQTLGMASGSNPLGGTLGGFAHKSEQVPGIQINQTLIVPDKSVADYAAQRTGNRIYRATNVGK